MNSYPRLPKAISFGGSETGRLWSEAAYRADDYAVGSLVCEVAGRRDNHLEGDLPLPRGVNKAGKRVQRLRPLVNKGFAASNMLFLLRFFTTMQQGLKGKRKDSALGGFSARNARFAG